MENVFLFHLKSSFCSQDIYEILKIILTFRSHRKNSLIKNIRLVFKIYDVCDWLTNNYNTHYPISQEVKITRQ